MTYAAKHYSTRETPQSEQADSRQVPNSAGGFVFELDKWKRLERFLILGAEGGTYYATERKLVRENAKSLEACLDEDPARAVNLIVEISDSGRAPKNDEAIFALALAAGHPKARTLALEALPKVCRIGTHLFDFVNAVKGFRGWGRSLRRAVANWYDVQEPKRFMEQVTKYQQRNGVSHRDLFRLSHPELKEEHRAIARYVVDPKNLGERNVVRGKDGTTANRST